MQSPQGPEGATALLLLPRKGRPHHPLLPRSTLAWDRLFSRQGRKEMPMLAQVHSEKQQTASGTCAAQLLSCNPQAQAVDGQIESHPKKKSGRSWHQERPRPRGASVAQHRALPKPLALRAVPAGCGGSGRPRSALCFHCSHLRFYSLQLTSGEILPRRN